MSALGCNYEAPTFGAHYPDGTCIDGYMWDLDSCDEPGGGLCSGGDQPCPWCNTVELLDPKDMQGEQLAALQAQLQKERADSQMRQNAILEQISKLRALEWEGVEA
jgi:hypothetical protein